MPPPDRDKFPRDASPLEDAGITESSRLRGNAAHLTSWVEWLLHPEEHVYDRTVCYPDGTKKEEPGVVRPPYTHGTDPQPPYDFESVIEGYQPWQFLHGMAAASRQQVQRADSLLGIGAAAMENIWWLGDKRVAALVNTLQELRTQKQWVGTASDAAIDFLLKLQTVATQVNKLVGEFRSICLRYAVIVTGLRDNLDDAAAGLIKSFEDKFAAKPEFEFSTDVAGAVLAGIAAAAVTYVSGGTATLIVGSAITSTWSTAFTDAAKKLIQRDDKHDSVMGYWWRDLVRSYMTSQANIVNEAKEEVNTLNSSITSLFNRFNGDPDIQAFMQKYAS